MYAFRESAKQAFLLRQLMAVLLLLLYTSCAGAAGISAAADTEALDTEAKATPPTADIVVAKDGSGNYKSIQDAIDAVRAFTPKRITIFVKNGVYKEKVLIPAWVTDITLRGESPDSTILSFDDHAGRGKMGTFDSYTLRIMGNNINVEDMTIANTAGPVGQAVALHVEGDRLVFRNCRLLGDQDTLFASGEKSRQYYVNCYIEGTTDFIFGPATALFQNCHIHSKKNSYITAASTPAWVKWGYVFKNCVFTAAEGVDKVYLGRPWRDYAKTVILNSELGAHILPQGWHNWSRPEAEKTVLYAEYNNRGPGAAPAGRVGWSQQLSAEEAARYTPEVIFAGDADDSAGDTGSPAVKWYKR